MPAKITIIKQPDRYELTGCCYFLYCTLSKVEENIIPDGATPIQLNRDIKLASKKF